MTKNELHEIILNGENSVVEFKNDAVEPHRVARELVGFLNSFGGTLLLGVDDDGNISGVTRPDIGEWITNLCRDKIRPEIIPRIEMIRESASAKTVAVVSVEPGYTVHCRWHNNSRDYFIRANDQTREPSTEELERLFQRRGNLRAELRPINSASIGCFDLNRIEDYFQRIRGQLTPHHDDLEGWVHLLRNTELMAEGQHGDVGTLAGVALFVKQPERFLPQAGIDAVAYLGTEKDYNAKERSSLRGPMTGLTTDGSAAGLVESAMAFAKRHILEGESLKDSIRREPHYLLPLEAVREAIVNALVHRDYLLTATNIELSIYADRMEVISPGRPTNGITPERMRVGCRAARNQLIKDTMRDYGYMEHMGMGIPRKMFAAMRDANLPEPEILIGDESTTVRFRWT
jgi:ATP-dependent DNA helicase RecG